MGHLRMCVCVCVCWPVGFYCLPGKGWISYSFLFCFRFAREMVNRHVLTPNASAGSTTLCHKLGDDWIALEQGKVNKEHTNGWLECDSPLRRNITSVGVRVSFQNL